MKRDKKKNNMPKLDKGMGPVMLGAVVSGWITVSHGS